MAVADGEVLASVELLTERSGLQRADRSSSERIEADRSGGIAGPERPIPGTNVD